MNESCTMYKWKAIWGLAIGRASILIPAVGEPCECIHRIIGIKIAFNHPGTCVRVGFKECSDLFSWPDHKWRTIVIAPATSLSLSSLSVDKNFNIFTHTLTNSCYFYAPGLKGPPDTSSNGSSVPLSVCPSVCPSVMPSPFQTKCNI